MLACDYSMGNRMRMNALDEEVSVNISKFKAHEATISN